MNLRRLPSCNFGRTRAASYSKKVELRFLFWGRAQTSLPLLPGTSAADASTERLRHHDPAPAAFSGPAPPGRLLLLRGKVSGGVEGAASHRGDRDHRPQRRSLAALLPRSPGQTQLPQGAHHRVVGRFPCPPSFSSPAAAAVQKVNGI